MVRVFVVYEQEPELERFERHAELCRQVTGGTFRHGPVFGAPVGEPLYRYYAEWEFPDREAFQAASRTAEFVETARDAQEMGIPFRVHFTEVSE